MKNFKCSKITFAYTNNIGGYKEVAFLTTPLKLFTCHIHGWADDTLLLADAGGEEGVEC